MAAILSDGLFDQMNALVDELFVAESVDELKAFGKDVWRSLHREAPNVTVLVFNRIQAALDCLGVIEENRIRGIHVSRYTGKSLDCRSPAAKAIQDGIYEDEDQSFVKREIGAVKERHLNLA